MPDGSQCRGKSPVVQDPIVRLIDWARFAILAADQARQQEQYCQACNNPSRGNYLIENASMRA